MGGGGKIPYVLRFGCEPACVVGLTGFVQVPQGSLVPGRRLVLPACELEAQYCRYGALYIWNRCGDLELQCRTGAAG